MTRDWYKTIIVKKQGITNRKINIVLTYTGTQDVLYILQLPPGRTSSNFTKCPSQFHFLLILQFTMLILASSRLTRWSHKVELFPVRIHPPSHLPPKFERLGSQHLLCWSSIIFQPQPNLDLECGPPSSACSWIFSDPSYRSAWKINIVSKTSINF